MSVNTVLTLALAGAAAAEPATVRAVEVQVAEGNSDELRATGTLEPRHELRLGFAIGGVVSDVLAADGATVAEGDPLARLDRIPAQAAVADAEAKLSFLEGRVARSDRLLEERAISPEEAEADRSQLASARAALSLARWNLERSTLRAPFSGRVVRNDLEIGQVVSPGAEAVHLLDASELELRAAIPAAMLDRADEGGELEVRIVDGPERTAVGRIHHRPVRGDERSGTVPLLVIVDNSQGHLLPGLIAEVSLPRARTQEIRIPLSALRVGQDGHSVWRLDSGIARSTEVRVGQIHGSEIVVLKGLAPGDRIVDGAPDRLRDGDAVHVAATRESAR